MTTTNTPTEPTFPCEDCGCDFPGDAFSHHSRICIWCEEAKANGGRGCLHPTHGIPPATHLYCPLHPETTLAGFSSGTCRSCGQEMIPVPPPAVPYEERRAAAIREGRCEACLDRPATAPGGRCAECEARWGWESGN